MKWISQLTKIIFNRVQKVEPENVVKIMGCMLIKEPGEQEMVQMAFGPDAALMSKIADYKVMLGKLPPRISDHHQQYTASLSPGSRPVFSQATFPSFWDPQLSGSDDYPPLQNFIFGLGDDCPVRNQAHSLKIDGQLDPMNPIGNHYYEDAPFPPRARRTPSLPDFKVCHYFLKGFCKHGNSCRYFHGQPFADGYSSPMFGPNGNEFANDHGFSAGSLEKLEMEITELLRSRRGMPVSIASLPMLYFEKYGKNLQADGYLTESQRHGKSGFSLTKLLARLKNSIRLIDRPHGQHSVILAEDAPTYMECSNDRRDPGAIVASSHQIYLTFPAESTFTEDDVSNYFKQYGPVRDVRIPSQEKRMFGFVSFLYPETVNMILMKRNPHYICGARVLVKQYRKIKDC
ncbi:zinc finger CCCH domain-containing protein 54-like [Iris pallida]|uniref:Zinc finger CCCH domain-containing protein 54-like n=1 Tax=Iris pallida TaxID=29817 RepID=A0AAX6I6W5_IRIPA|nr:zinc finger CCCH domain-containing protein 54-like [Iris pallida]